MFYTAVICRRQKHMYGAVADEIIRKAKNKVKTGQTRASLTRELLAVRTMWQIYWYSATPLQKPPSGKAASIATFITQMHRSAKWQLYLRSKGSLFIGVPLYVYLYSCTHVWTFYVHQCVYENEKLTVLIIIYVF